MSKIHFNVINGTAISAHMKLHSHIEGLSPICTHMYKDWEGLEREGACSYDITDGGLWLGLNLTLNVSRAS